MKKVLQIVLGLAIIALAYVIYNQITSTTTFNKELEIRKEAVVDRIKDIRTAQRAYKQVNQRYTPSMDTLIDFVLNGTIDYEKRLVSEDDSAAMAELKKKGLKNVEIITMNVIDTIFGTKKVTPEDVKNFKLIPYGNGAEFIMDAGELTTESKVVVPVFVCKAPYKTFMADLSHQELVNLIDSEKNLNRYPGVKVGDMYQATNDAGNWE